MRKDKKLKSSEIIENNTNAINNLNDILFSENSDENKVDIAKAKGLLFSLVELAKGKIIPKRIVKSMTFLKQTNDINYEIISELELSMINIKGKSRNQWIDIVKTALKSMKEVEKDEKKGILPFLKR